MIKPDLLVSGPVRQALVHAALPHQDQDGLSGRRLDEASHCVLSLSLSLSRTQSRSYSRNRRKSAMKLVNLLKEIVFSTIMKTVPLSLLRLICEF